MLVVYAGGLGQGKTLGIVSQGLKIKKKNPQLQLYANFPNKIGAKMITTWAELIQLRKAIVLIDEGHEVFDSRKSKENVNKTHFALMSRHYDLIIIIATQVLDQIDLRVRRIVDYVVICEKKYWRNQYVSRPQKYFVYHYMKASAFVTGSFRIGRKEIMRKPQLFYGLYDTKGTITNLS